MDMGKRCKLPEQGLQLSPSRSRIICNLVLKYDIWWQQFGLFFRESTHQILCSLNNKDTPEESKWETDIRRRRAITDFARVNE